MGAAMALLAQGGAAETGALSPPNAVKVTCKGI